MTTLLEKINSVPSQEYTVGELVNNAVLFAPLDGNHGGIHPKSQDYVKKGIPFIMASDISDEGTVDLESCKFISETQAKNLKKGFAKNGDILLSHKATIGRVAELKTTYDYVVLTPQVTYYRVKDDRKILPEYLKYYFRSPRFQSILSVFASSGSTRDYVGIQRQEGLPIVLKDIDAQKNIVRIVDPYDKKIENNNLIISMLGTLAQVLFDEWFVKFQYPGHEKFKRIGSEIGEIPEKWVIKPLDEIAIFLNGVPSQKYPPAENEPSLPVIKIREMNSGIDANTDRANTNIDAKYIIQNGDVLFSWSGSLELMIWSNGLGILNQHIFKVTSGEYPKWFYYYWIKRHMNSFRAIASGKATTMGHIQRHHISSALVLVPTSDVMQEANSIFTPIFEKITALQHENQVLKESRDQLLAKLI